MPYKLPRTTSASHARLAPRPLLSLPYVKDWYWDAVNHPTRHTPQFDDLANKRLKKLLVRIDTRQHHEALYQASVDGSNACDAKSDTRGGWFS